jgi:hypothetical protein
MGQIVRSFSIVERVLRDRTNCFAEIGGQEDLPSKIVDMLTMTFLGLGLFGLAMGATGGLPWMLASLVKLPALFFLSLAICLPTLYHFSLLFGGRLTFSQTVALLLTAQTVTAILNLGFALISLFFRLTGSNYAFMVVLSVAMLAVSGCTGLIFLVQGALYLGQGERPAHVGFWDWTRFFVGGGIRSMILVGWIGLFGIVGTQMAWALRPYFGAPGSDFVLFVPLEGSFFQGFLHILERLVTGG